MSLTTFSGQIAVECAVTQSTTVTLASGAGVADLSSALSAVTGAVATRHNTGGGAAVEVQLDTPGAGQVTVDDGSGTSSDVVTVIAFGTPA